MFDLQAIVRENIKQLVPYSSARDEYTAQDTSHIMLDANESPFQNGINRYPDPYQFAVKEKLSDLKGIRSSQMFLGNGSDEAIDLLIRAFCEPGKQKILITPPTYGMYKVSADINNVAITEVPLTKDFQLDVASILDNLDGVNLVFLCSPINPTANLLRRDDILAILRSFDGLVVVDEAYIDFCIDQSLSSELDNYPNLVILQTLSKAWGMAGLRLGIALASESIIEVFNRIKPPYNVNILTQQKVLELLDREEDKNDRVVLLLEERNRVSTALQKFQFVIHVYPSDANFLLVKFEEAAKIFHYLQSRQVIIRDRSNLPGCEGCLRVTIGTPAENDKLLTELTDWNNG